MWPAVAIVALVVVALVLRDGPVTRGATWTLVLRAATKDYGAMPEAFQQLRDNGHRVVVYVRKVGPGAAERAKLLLAIDAIADGNHATGRVLYGAGFERLPWMPPPSTLVAITTAEIVGLA